MSDIDLNQHLLKLEPYKRIEWALERYDQKLVLSTSFGVQSAVMLHMTTQVFPDIPVIFVDTGYLFEKTYQFAEKLTAQLKLNLKVFSSPMTAARQEALFGKRWTQSIEDLEQYNLQNKVEPMNRALSELEAEAWMSGLRRTQSSSRGKREFIERQKKTVKTYPILDWTDRDVYVYLNKFHLPYHPMWDEGYVSLGDWHSTSKLTAGMKAEDTRFKGMKRECGLHEISDNVDFQI